MTHFFLSGNTRFFRDSVFVFPFLLVSLNSHPLIAKNDEPSVRSAAKFVILMQSPTRLAVTAFCFFSEGSRFPKALNRFWMDWSKGPLTMPSFLWCMVPGRSFARNVAANWTMASLRVDSTIGFSCLPTALPLTSNFLSLSPTRKHSQTKVRSFPWSPMMSGSLSPWLGMNCLHRLQTLSTREQDSSCLESTILLESASRQRQRREYLWAVERSWNPLEPPVDESHEFVLSAHCLVDNLCSDNLHDPGPLFRNWASQTHRWRFLLGSGLSAGRHRPSLLEPLSWQWAWPVHNAGKFQGVSSMDTSILFPKCCLSMPTNRGSSRHHLLWSTTGCWLPCPGTRARFSLSCAPRSWTFSALKLSMPILLMCALQFQKDRNPKMPRDLGCAMSTSSWRCLSQLSPKTLSTAWGPPLLLLTAWMIAVTIWTCLWFFLADGSGNDGSTAPGEKRGWGWQSRTLAQSLSCPLSPARRQGLDSRLSTCLLAATQGAFSREVTTQTQSALRLACPLLSTCWAPSKAFWTLVMLDPPCGACSWCAPPRAWCGLPYSRFPVCQGRRTLCFLWSNPFSNSEWLALPLPAEFPSPMELLLLGILEATSVTASLLDCGESWDPSQRRRACSPRPSGFYQMCKNRLGLDFRQMLISVPCGPPQTWLMLTWSPSLLRATFCDERPSDQTWQCRSSAGDACSAGTQWSGWSSTGTIREPSLGGAPCPLDHSLKFLS